MNGAHNSIPGVYLCRVHSMAGLNGPVFTTQCEGVGDAFSRSTVVSCSTSVKGFGGLPKVPNEFEENQLASILRSGLP